MVRPPLWAAGLCALLWSALAARGTGQEVDPHLRSNALFDAGKRLLAEGDVAGACESFAESQRLEPRGGTLLNLGLCHERQGQLLAAHRELTEALEMARRDARADREPIALEHLAAIEAHLAWLSISLPHDAAAQSVVVKLDGSAITPEASKAIPVEAGEHVVSLEAAGFESQQTKLSLGPGERVSVPLQPLRARVVAQPAPLPARPHVVAQPAQVEPSRPYAMPRTVALIVGVVGLAASAITGALAWGQKGVVADHCDAHKRCDARGLEAAEAGRALTLSSNIAFATGVVGLGVWVALPGGLFNPEHSTERALGAGVRGGF